MCTKTLPVLCRILCPVQDSLPCPPANPLCFSLTSCPCAWQGQCEAKVPQGKLFQFHVTPVLSKDLFFVDSEPLPCPGRPAADLAPLTEVPVLSSKPVLRLLQQKGLQGPLLWHWSCTWRPSEGLVCSMCCSTSPSPWNPLLQAMESEISAAFDSGEPEDILSRAFKLTVTREDICTLQPLGWLNDRVRAAALPGKSPFPGHSSLPGAPLQSPGIAVLSLFWVLCGLVFLEAFTWLLQLPGVSLGYWSGCGGCNQQHRAPGVKFWEQKLPAGVLSAPGWLAKTCCCLFDSVSYFTSQFASLCSRS